MYIGGIHHPSPPLHAHTPYPLANYPETDYREEIVVLRKKLFIYDDKSRFYGNLYHGFD